MRSLFVDTWAWFAINIIEDRDHIRANRVHRELIQHRYNYVTSNFVLDEAYSLIRRKGGFQRAISFGCEIRRVADLNILTIVTITPEIEREAWHLFEMYESVNGYPTPIARRLRP